MTDSISFVNGTGSGVACGGAVLTIALVSSGLPSIKSALFCAARLIADSPSVNSRVWVWYLADLLCFLILNYKKKGIQNKSIINKLKD